MDAESILISRLHNQLLIDSQITEPKDIVSYMGAMQAQDFNMAKWAIGVRLKGSTDVQIEDAVNRGDIIRLHILRPTWHFVSKDDIHWMLQLCSSRLEVTYRSYDKILGVNPESRERINRALVEVLEKEQNLTRQELVQKLKEKGISFDDERIFKHMLFWAELDGVICNGVVRNKKQTYDLLENRAPKKEIYDKEESLHNLAYKYFRSHGPATLQDFVWWSGLSTADARKGMETIRKDFVFEKLDKQTYIFHNSSIITNTLDDVVHLLPAFDELFVSYRDRKEILEAEHLKKVIVSNGVFKPTVFHNGRVIGIWNRIVRKDKVICEVSCFGKQTKLQKLVEGASLEYNNYMGNV